MSARDGKDKAASPFRQGKPGSGKVARAARRLHPRVESRGVDGARAVLLLLLAGFIWACCGRLVDTMPTALVVQRRPRDPLRRRGRGRSGGRRRHGERRQRQAP